jgi:hypothetical protein
MEYERVEALSDWIKMAAATGFPQEKIAALVRRFSTAPCWAIFARTSVCHRRFLRGSTASS